ncbi:ATP-dependent RNA helicase SUPV3L1/SUV3 [Loktanella fryxellensis]|uniref:ATP-dependent RNA helicase SUPV3L1/SUV3 n=1 Tax=Loktanella fryxellensis TaxID=245187 RepID=A0A1H8GH96_9RHOB|nr:helicase-related protein [Loktanella fryxellensis]SEN43343.1 ATP-dependent RNA helicase SUPV3L1/SUV3 [Loktanella fryxellensis]
MQPSRVTAILGPTNTGKTHHAIERMLGHRTGVIGLPLRLLAREVYDRIVKARGPGVVALVTGEERIVPPRTAYWVCTVEAMPEGLGCDFLAVDEIQLCGDPERGHVFTDRLLHARGLHETLFMGADTMRQAIVAMIPGVVIQRRERFSELTYAGSKKLSRMPARAAIVGFSVENCYAIAELIRRQKGGAAVVMGALSPRTRNAQVELYQNGDVDYLVATDAIGMGLNLDITHVAFSATAKFDGARMRELRPDELAQIAGRAGRHLASGTFGVTGEAQEFDEGVIGQIVNHQFPPLKRLQWRNTDLQFGSVKRLLQTLEARTDNDWLTRVRESDDLAALRALGADEIVAARASDGPSVRLLWDVCRIPDFRGISRGEHAGLLMRIFTDLHQTGHVDENWFALQVARIDRNDGDIDTLSKRLAFIRTWTYVAQRKGWLRDESHWRDHTRAVEDRLSDALHGALTQRFVDRRTSVLLRRLKQKESLLADVNDKGEVTVEGEFIGRLEGFRFRMDKAGSPDEAKTLRQASAQALAPQFHLRADRFYNAPDTEMDITEQGGLMWGTAAVGKLVAGDDPLKPRVVAFVDDDAGADVATKVQRRLQHFIDRKIATAFEPLLALKNDETLTGAARGFAYRMAEQFGIISRSDVVEEVKALDQDARAALRKHGIRFGQFTIFQPLLLKPAPTRLRLVLWSLAKGLQEFPESPPPGLVTVPADATAAQGYYTMAGYRAAGARAIRIDMLERLADLLRDRDSKAGFEAVPEMLSITGTTLDQFADLMGGLGYHAEKAERPKFKAAKSAPAATNKPGDAPGEGVPVEPEDRPAPDAPVEEPAPDAPAPDAPAPPPADAPEVPPADAPQLAESEEDAKPVEVETFYTFTWGRAARQGNRGPRRDATRGDASVTEGDAPRKEGGRRAKPEGRSGATDRSRFKPQPNADGTPHEKPQARPQGKPGGARGPKPVDKPQTFDAKPAKVEKKIDPDNPFAAALQGFKAR